MRLMLTLILVLAVQSSSPSDPARLAVEAYEREDFAQSVKLFEEAVRQSPTSIILQLHLANAQARWCIQNPRDPDARTRADLAETTLQNILKESPQNRLALWDLAMLYGFEGRVQDSQQTLATLLQNDPSDVGALTASGTMAAMQIHFNLQDEKRKTSVRLEGPARISDERLRESLRTQFEPRIRAAVAMLDRASQLDTGSSQPLVMLNLLYRMEAELAESDQEFQTLIRKADALVDRATALNHEQEQHPHAAQKKLSPMEPPPRLPGPPVPPPPPPKPPGLK